LCIGEGCLQRDDRGDAARAALENDLLALNRRVDELTR
jgi:hypothetical protein